MQQEGTGELTPTERVLIGIGTLLNNRPAAKRLQRLYQDFFPKWIIHAMIARRVYADRVERLTSLNPDRGVILATNHRSYFDLYVATLILLQRKWKWLGAVTFPVRSNFFYDDPRGMLINLLAGGGAMYPPIFRSAEKRGHNDESLEKIKEILSWPGQVVGIHPEGTRNEGDPYKLLPAHPGIGQIILQSKPLVVPVFINGLSNDWLADTRNTHRRDARQNHAVIATFGEPFDYSDYLGKKPRLVLYKKLADEIMVEIGKCGQRERELRERLNAGDMLEPDNWLTKR